MPTQICTTEGCPFKGGYCRRIHSSEEQKATLQEKKPAKDKVSKKPGEKSDLTLWFEEKISSCNWKCEECGKACKTSNQAFKLAAQAHLLPKAIFKSVATHPDNYACLPAYGCGHHNTYDASWHKASKMKFWPLALERIMKLIPLLPSKEYAKLPDIIRNHYEKLSTTVYE